MNCKPGDLAIVVRVSKTTEHALGLYVTVCRAADPSFYSESLGLLGAQPVWLCRTQREIAGWNGEFRKEFKIPDACLRPIRNNPGEDETLSWVPIPPVKFMVKI